MRRLLAVLVLLTVSCSRAPSYFVQTVVNGVREGWAWYYRGSPAIGPYKDAEAAAKAAHLGLWRDPAPINPKLWRKAHPSKGGGSYHQRKAKDS